MSSRTVVFLGPLLLLYVALDVAARGGGLRMAAWAPIVLGLMAAVAPAFAARGEIPGRRRVAWLGFAGAAVAVRAVDPSGASRLAEVVGDGGLALLAGVSVELAAHVPSPSGARRSSLLLRIAAGLSAGAAWALWENPWHVLGIAAGDALAVGVLGLGLTVRALRLRREPEPLRHALHGSALMGLGLAVACVTAHLRFPTEAWAGVALMVGVVALVTSHVGMLDTTHAARAGRLFRALLGHALAAVLGAVATATILHFTGARASDPAAWGAAALGAVVALGARPALAGLLDRGLAPFSGRLLGATGAIRGSLGAHSTLEGLVRDVLRPLRWASQKLDAEPLLYTTTPAAEFRIDAAGEPHRRAVPMPDALRAHLLEHPGEIVVRAAIAPLVVRRPQLRAVVDAMTQLDALCAVPLVVEGELEGVLTVPEGARRAPLRMEELDALAQVASGLASTLAMLLRAARAEERSRRAELAKAPLEAALERAETELTDRRNALRAWLQRDPGTSAHVAYGPAVRGLLHALQEAAPHGDPITLVGDPRAGLEAFVRVVHAASGRREEPCVSVPVAAHPTRELHRLLFGARGTDATTGWLELAEGGTLYLEDVQVLPLEVQSALARAVAERQASTVGTQPTSYPVNVRLVVSLRVPPAALAERGALDPELAERLGARVHPVPGLGDRNEDLPSLVFLLIDRHTRIQGKAPVGIEPVALERLVGHAWPGELPELDAAVAHAVRRTGGPRIGLDDLPPLGASEGDGGLDPLAGTLDEIEERVLLHALERAQGNKSEAARLLGIARTTFLDKLKRVRHGSEATRALPANRPDSGVP